MKDTGIQIELLQEYLLIPLDIFRINLQNKGIRDELDAWLTILSVDEPERIEQLIRDYPQFIPMYEQIYEICRNTERVMELFSEELKILDRNTVQLMIDEMQEEIDVQKETIIQAKKQLTERDQEIERLKKLLAEK